MRLCRNSFRALSRSLVAVGLMSGVIALFALAAAAMLAQLIDARLSGAAPAASLPQAIIFAISVLGALLGKTVRDTMLNRRRIWLAHGLGGAVVSHEIWRGSDARHRTRSLSAVDAIAEFVGSPAAQALTLAPWAIAMIAALWLIHADVAAVASAILLVQVALAFLGARMTRSARQFDVDDQAWATGQDVFAAGRDSVSMDRARAIADRWEAAQALRFGSAYRDVQRQSRREALLNALDLSSAIALLLAAAYGTSNGLSVGSLAAVTIVALGSLRVMSRVVLEAPVYARARAARRQLITLRVAKTRQGAACLPAIAAPRMRGPIAAGLLTTAAAAAAIAVTAVAWRLPVAMAAWDAIGWASPAVAPQASLPDPVGSGQRDEAPPLAKSDAAKTRTVPKGRS